MRNLLTRKSWEGSKVVERREASVLKRFRDGNTKKKEGDVQVGPQRKK